MKLKFPLVIDGGISNELEALGCDLNHDLWTSRLLDSDEEAIRQVHLNYMRAGAQCVASASYQASIPGLMNHGYSHEEARSLIQKSISLVSEARTTFYEENDNHHEVNIVGSIGPYGAYLADGSEYKGNYGLTHDQLNDFHEERLQLFIESDADIIAFETIPDYTEAQVIAQLSQNISKPSWISFSCKDDHHISDGTPLSECGQLFRSHPSVFAIGANCIPPDYVPGVLNTLKENVGNKKIIIYPNSGGHYDSNGKKWYANDEKFALKNHADEWINLGADILGGCCKIGAEEIGELKEYLNAKNI